MLSIVQATNVCFGGKKRQPLERDCTGAGAVADFPIVRGRIPGMLNISTFQQLKTVYSPCVSVIVRAPILTRLVCIK